MKPETEDPSKPQVELNRAEWIAVFTLLVIFAQSCVNYWTLSEIKKTTTATQTAANAAQTQANVSLSQTNAIERSANAAQTQANASTIQANISEIMVKQNERVVRAGESQANTSQVSARAAEISAGAAKDSVNISTEALRAFISIKEVRVASFEPDKPISFFLTWQNDGNSPVDLFTDLSRMMIGAAIPTESSCRPTGKNTAVIVVSPRGTKSQTASGKNTFISSEIDEVRKGSKYLTICGSAAYTTIGVKHSFVVCSYSTKDLILWLDCRKD